MTPADDKEKIDLIADHIEEIIRLLEIGRAHV